MENFSEFLSSVIFPILCTAVTAIMGYVGLKIKKSMDEKDLNETKKQVVEMCVKATEQIYKDLHGTAKFDKCVEGASEMLATKGIEISEFELKMLVESALAEFNKAFEKTDEKTEITFSETSTDADGSLYDYSQDPVEVCEID